MDIVRDPLGRKVRVQTGTLERGRRHPGVGAIERVFFAYARVGRLTFVRGARCLRSFIGTCAVAARSCIDGCRIASIR